MLSSRATEVREAAEAVEAVEEEEDAVAEAIAAIDVDEVVTEKPMSNTMTC